MVTRLWVIPLLIYGRGSGHKEFKTSLISVVDVTVGQVSNFTDLLGMYLKVCVYVREGTGSWPQSTPDTDGNAIDFTAHMVDRNMDGLKLILRKTQLF